MHSAPSVSYPVGRSRFQTVLLVGLSMAGFLAGLFWRQQAQPASWQQALSAALWVAASAAAWQSWHDSPSGSLSWDGRQWRWSDGSKAVSGAIEVRLDWQRCLLLRLHGASGGAIWLWLERGRDRCLWEALRRAAFSEVSANQERVPPATDSY